MGYLDIAKVNTNQWASKCLVSLLGTLHTVYNTRIQSFPYKATKTTVTTSSVFSVTQNVLTYDASLSEDLPLGCLVPPTYP